jgi:hypothetical protein
VVDEALEALDVIGISNARLLGPQQVQVRQDHRGVTVEHGHRLPPSRILEQFARAQLGAEHLRVVHLPCG